MSVGLISFYNFFSGDHLYDLNTHTIYRYPETKLKLAIFANKIDHKKKEHECVEADEIDEILN